MRDLESWERHWVEKQTQEKENLKKKRGEWGVAGSLKIYFLESYWWDQLVLQDSDDEKKPLEWWWDIDLEDRESFLRWVLIIQ